jgi:hypothetical protein
MRALITPGFPQQIEVWSFPPNDDYSEENRWKFYISFVNFSTRLYTNYRGICGIIFI